MFAIAKVFAFGFTIDLAYVLWVRAVANGKSLLAGCASVLIATPALFGYVEVYENRIMAIPYLAGLFCGTVVAVKRKEPNED